ncbi:hypothetical protein TPR58_07250 [Sphingomonas sp. HF-S3]|uniref:Uncharacterized protein n=1 Tax=Sphingomonas rustica TaxID=3103142 RepID=A0ABV0B5T0_9SPHN
MKTFLMIAALVSLPAASAAAAPELPQRGVPDTCSVTVSFGSYAMGIDRPALERTERLLKRDRTVRRTSSHRWGREGEMTLCAITRRPADARRLFQRVKAALPRDPRGPITIETHDGLSHTASRPMR